MLTPEFEKRMANAEKKRQWMKRRYWEVRLAVIAYLGGECIHCHTTDIKVLEVHHDPPRLEGGYKNTCGGEILKEWLRITRGEVKAKLVCNQCHVPMEHEGNTNSLKKVKDGVKGNR